MSENKQAQRRKQKHLAKRNIVRKYLLKNPCIDCGETDPLVLQFDHVYGDKKINISKMIYKNYSIKTLLDEIAKCEIRCANCHQRKTAKDFDYFKNLEE